jgi:large subunit ribosomal protein L1
MPKKKNNTSPVTAEKAAEHEAEALSIEADEASQAVENLDEQAEKALIAEVAADADAETPAEVAAISETNESAEDLNKDGLKGVKKTNKTPKKAEAKSRRSPKHLKASEQIEKGKLYNISEAIELIKKASYSKFDGSMELHLKLTKKKSKGSTESSRGVFHLPHGTGKTKKIVILDEAKIEEIAKTKKIDFDIAIATPELMPKVGKIAKILGPQGKMPDPKSGTVTADPKKAIAEIESGKIEYRIDSSNNIHQIVGKCSWESTKIEENIKAILASFPTSKIAACYLTATMAPSAMIDLSGK